MGLKYRESADAALRCRYVAYNSTDYPSTYSFTTSWQLPAGVACPGGCILQCE